MTLSYVRDNEETEPLMPQTFRIKDWVKDSQIHENLVVTLEDLIYSDKYKKDSLYMLSVPYYQQKKFKFFLDSNDIFSITPNYDYFCGFSVSSSDSRLNIVGLIMSLPIINKKDLTTLIKKENILGQYILNDEKTVGFNFTVK